VAKRKGLLIFCGLMFMTCLAWVALAHLDDRDRDYEKRLIGALKFLDGTIETSRDFDAGLYAPSIAPRSQPGRWVLSGLMVPRDSAARQPRFGAGLGPFSAVLENICRDYADPACWRLEKLSVGGQAVNLSALASSDRPGALEGGSRGFAKEVSAPKESFHPIPVETVATQSMTVSPPIEDATRAVEERLPCVEPAAWRDPDVGRNRQLIIDEEICLRAIEITENGLKWRVQVLDSGRPGSNWIVVHDDEDTAFDSALYAIVRYGGKVVDVDLLSAASLDAIVDPNHNFAVTDAQMQRCGGPNRQPSPVFTSTIIKELGDPPYLALHNNYDGHFRGGGHGNISVRHSTRGLFGLPAYDPVGRLADEDNFIIVSGLTPPGSLPDRIRHLTEALRYSGINVIYEYVHEDSYDCSLSNYLLLYGGAEPGQYFNVESEIGDYRSQVTMINALVGTLINSSRISQLEDDVLLADELQEVVPSQH
jgi:hypothetical protein